ncbi:hypothetical protein BC830DRAFT_1217818 [Chytriomyces sp. MP71]|nr:hypothetical protein BC830DRAFT_1217818 [Chytriomyces sp. MP71]
MKRVSLHLLPIVLVLASFVHSRTITPEYFGGPLVEMPEITAVFVGNLPSQDRILRFLDYLTRSPLMDLVIQDYRTPANSLKHGRLIGSIQLNSATLGVDNILDDARDIRPLLRSLVSGGTLNPNSNSLYVIYLAPGITLRSQGSYSCRDICAYHDAIDMSTIALADTTYLFYIVIPDLENCAGCASSPNPFDSLTTTTTHELLESIVNPAGTLGFMQPPAGWISRTYEEIGDACNGETYKIMDEEGEEWIVQKIWSRTQGMCATGPNSPGEMKG